MCNLNFGYWNSRNLQKYKLSNINLEERVLYLKEKIIKILDIDEIDKIELLHCGFIMLNAERVSTYMQYSDYSIIYVIENNAVTTPKKPRNEEQLKNMLEAYHKVFQIPGFEEIFLNGIQPETISILEANIPELSSDSVALSILRDPFLLKTLLEPSALKFQMEKHPALLIAAHYLIENILQETLGQNYLYSSFHVTDEDFSDGDGIEGSYSEQIIDRPATSAFNPITTSQLASALESAHSPTQQTTENGDVFRVPSITNTLRDVLFDHGNGSANMGGPNTINLMNQFHQMHQMGLQNDLLNFRALEVADGDVQVAIELILNRIID
ncbi:hypothetical protein WA026_007602 [Henosepilachna vigintioctopunctata]|uniref:UBA domain-containing protein n=1 Tax=Henosepilachna vigintioctopunctata TaxID=420089 RepID=A0AAW1UPL2_9CUCU